MRLSRDFFLFFTDFYAVFLNIDLSYKFLIQIRNLQGLD